MAKKMGRPPMGEKTMKKRLVVLDERSIRKAKKLGQGNVSAGVRKALQKA